jgi:hypothetical protein
MHFDWQTLKWQESADIATTVGVIITALGLIATLIVTTVLSLRSERLTRQGLELTRHGLDQDRINAENTASRAEAAARVTEGYTSRVVEALEAMATKGIPGVSPPSGSRVRWSLAHVGGERYILTNVGNAVAEDVAVSSHESLPLLGIQGGPDLGPDEAMSFIAAPSFSTSDITITVEWDDEDASRGVWKYPLPMPSR